MAFTDTSKEPRWPQLERREAQERRKVSYAFGSSQWLAHVKSHKLIPSKDRRKQNRRGSDVNTGQSLQRLTELQHYAGYANELSPDLFSREEINLIRTVLSGRSK